MPKGPKVKKALKALGFKQEKPKELRGHEDATKPYRFKKGDNTVQKNNGGARLQLIPPGAVATQRKRLSELVKEFQHLPLAKELASAMGIEGEATLVEAVTMGLFLAAIKGDMNATKLIQALTEPEKKPGEYPANPPALQIVIVDDKPEIPAPQPKELPAPPQPPLPPFAVENKETEDEPR